MNVSVDTVTSELKTRLTSLIARGRIKRGNRLLVHEIVSIQVISAALIGALAIAGLYWGGQWILQDNYGRWALQWTEELNELGAPLYLADDSEALIRLESYVERYPEIARVAYFDAKGAAIVSVGNTTDTVAVDNLSESALRDAIAVVGNKEPYLMSTGILEPQRFEILAPLWKESMSEDGLFDFDPSIEEPDATTELLGFVSIDLDFVLFHDRLLANIETAILVLLVLLMISCSFC